MIIREVIFRAYVLLVATFRWTGLGKIPPFEKAHQWLIRSLHPTRVVVDGHVVLIDPDDCGHLSYNNLHKGEVRFLTRQISPGSYVVDIGANIGYYTLEFARRVGPGGRVFAFEPHPQNFALLQANVLNNEYGNVTLCSAAVTDRTGRGQLFVSAKHAGRHCLHPSVYCEQLLEVELTRLDDYLGEVHHAIHLIKIDIEGEEPRALEGMLLTLERNPALRIFTEYNPAALAEAGVVPASYPARLLELGFTLYEVIEGAGRPTKVAPGELETKYPVTRNAYTNLWCVRDTR